MSVVAVAPGLYTQTEQRTQLVAHGLNGEPIALLRPARPGEVVRLRGSGFGLPPQQPVEVRVGGIPARVAGVRSGPDGDDLVEVEVPSGSKEGCFVPVVARTGGKWSNFGSLPVASGAGPCRMYGVAEGTLERTAASGLIRLGRIDLARSPFWVGVKFPSRKNRLSAAFEQQPVSALTGFPPNGTCTLHAGVGDFTGQARQSSPAISSCAEASSQSGQSVRRLAFGSQREDAPWYVRSLIGIEKDGFVRTGPHVLQADAGPDVEQFSIQIPIQTRSPKWGNLPLQTAPRDKDLKLRWTGGRHGDLALITMRLFADGRTVDVLCAEAAEAVSFTIPAWLLDQFPDPGIAKAQLSLKVLAPVQTSRPKGLDSFSFTFSEQSL